MKITIFGAGSFGTAIARHISTASPEPHGVLIWCRRDEQARAINVSRRNPFSLPDARLGPSATAIGGDRHFDAAASASPFIILAVPAQAARGVMKRIAAVTEGGEGVHLLCLAKGIETDTGAFMHEAASDVLPGAAYSVLSGPSYADEIAAGMPTAVTVASDVAAEAAMWQESLGDERLRVYTSGDVAGTELGGSMKNVIAIGVGIARAAGFGDNSVAALVTRGLAEIMRCGAAFGANPMTLSGLAGAGDLMLTCWSPKSRNYRFGEAVGRGVPPEEAAAEIGQVVEGMHTARALASKARSEGLDLPICDAIYRVLYEGIAVRDALSELMSRAPKPELRGMGADEERPSRG